MELKEIKGDLIELALACQFDVIAHGINCFCVQKSGIAKQMSKHFATHAYSSEKHDGTWTKHNKGDVKKLGNIEWGIVHIAPNTRTHTINDKTPYVYTGHTNKINTRLTSDGWKYFHVVNCYTQFSFGRNKVHLDYAALTLCMRKINLIFKGKHIGLPLIGCGLAGGDWNRVKSILKSELVDMNVTIVHYNK